MGRGRAVEIELTEVEQRKFAGIDVQAWSDEGVAERARIVSRRPSCDRAVLQQSRCANFQCSSVLIFVLNLNRCFATKDCSLTGASYP
jgi:hypothetical protein